MNVLRSIALAASFAVFAAAAVAAQPAQQPNSPLNSANSDKPVKIESATLEVRDKSRMATFTGDVKLTQGDMLLRCKVLVVFYEDTAGPAAKNAPKTVGPASGQQKIKRVEAKGNVVITQNDQTVTGDNGVFEMKTNVVTVTGNVVVTQGASVVRGERMLVNLTTGVYTVERSNTGRVESVFFPNAPPKDTKDAKAAPPPPAKGAPVPQSSKSAPMRLN